MTTCDVLIVGSGIAGLSLAIKLQRKFPYKRIVIVTKDADMQSNTRHAQGGIAVVCNKRDDSFASHITDTLNAGGGLCMKEVVERVVERAPDALGELVENGSYFDRDNAGELLLAKEGGHSQARIVHYKDMTGFQIVVSLLIKVRTLSNVDLLTHHVAVDLITSETEEKKKVCRGLIVFDRKKNCFEHFIAPVTVLATGGVGQVYHSSTNPSVATGDGIAMAYRAGAVIKNMEFIQFHPTAFFLNDNSAPYFLITEALRGYGAYLRNKDGERFMFRYDTHGELACRDVVSRAIEEQIKSSEHTCVYLDCRHLNGEKLKEEFPKIYGHCIDRGIDICNDLIPVVPAAHYLCGGIEVDSSAMTTIKNLYALGECSNTGLHGANRLASNSLLEAVVFADFCFESITSTFTAPCGGASDRSMPVKYRIIETSCGIGLIKTKVQRLMTAYVGVSRSDDGLRHAKRYLNLLSEKFEEVYKDCFSPEINELRNLIVCAMLIVAQSLQRRTNVGVFYNKDLDIEHAVHK